MDEVTPFQFMECTSLLKATGKRAGNLRDLRAGIAGVSEQSLFHHTCQYFMKGHVLEYTNDFSQWAGESLEERTLSERLSNIDPFGVAEIGELRNELLSSIDDYLKNFPESRRAVPGDEFYFNETVSMIFPSGVQASNLAEFWIAVKYVDPSSIYYHFYEARVRHGTDDFSTWFEDALGKKDLAGKVRAIDPFMHPIEKIREYIAAAVDDAVRLDMEV
jgi:hypothetical protein